MRGLFSKRGLGIFGVLGIGLFGIGLFVVVSQRESIEARIAKQRLEAQAYAARIIPFLTHDKALVGEWAGVRSSGNHGYYRSFSKSGKLIVCYGDVIHNGTYEVMDKTTIETRNRYDGKVNRWTFGFLDGELILINQATSWVEEYRQVPPGTIQGPVLE